jgi:ribosomal protein S18 acetylase RimI-like enzyme
MIGTPPDNRIGRTVTLRPAMDPDEPFLAAVYFSTRVDELAPLPWSDEQKLAFLTQQHRAQHFHYHTYYDNAVFLVILVDGVPAGRLYLWRRPNQIQLVDIALLPQYRNSGIGTALVRDLVESADRAGLPIELHVEGHNPAMRLYERFGFQKVEDEGVYWRMLRPPAPQANRPHKPPTQEAPKAAAIANGDPSSPIRPT